MDDRGGQQGNKHARRELQIAKHSLRRLADVWPSGGEEEEEDLEGRFPRLRRQSSRIIFIYLWIFRIVP